MSEEDKKKYEEEQKTMEEKHKKHKPVSCSLFSICLQSRSLV